MAKLYFKYGTMGSGKSLELIRSSYNYIEKNQNVLLLSSCLDDRHGKDKIASRTGVEMPCISLQRNSDIVTIFKNQNKNKKIDCVFVDESQFLTKEQVKQLTEIVDRYNTPVIAYGLRTDFRLEVFEGSKYLLSISDEIQEIKSVCHCGHKATINARIVDGKITTKGEQVQIGGNESYISLCRKHFKEGKINK